MTMGQRFSLVNYNRTVLLFRMEPYSLMTDIVMEIPYNKPSALFSHY